jgi:hypothetical protein
MVFANMRGIVPAAFALGSVGAFNFDGESGKQFALHGTVRSGWFDFDLRNNEQRWQYVAPFLK